MNKIIKKASTGYIILFFYLLTQSIGSIMSFNESNFEEYVNEQTKHIDNGLATLTFYPEFSIFAAGAQVIILALIFIFIRIIFREVRIKWIVWPLFISMIIVILYFSISVTLGVFDDLN